MPCAIALLNAQVMEKKYKDVRGFYQSCLGSAHWMKDRHTQHWDLAVRYAPKLMEKMHEIPNWIRIACNLTNKKGRTSDHYLPMPLQVIIDTILAERIQINDEVSPGVISETIRACCLIYNAEVEKTTEEVHALNRKLREDLLLGRITEELAEERARAWPETCKATKSEELLRRAAEGFRKRFGWSRHGVKAGGTHLHYDDKRQQEASTILTACVFCSVCV